jgi:hypothetical protein
VQLSSLAPQAANAATETNFGTATTADLVELCTAAPAVALSEPPEEHMKDLAARGRCFVGR